MNDFDYKLNKTTYALMIIIIAITAIIILTGCAVTQNDSLTTLQPIDPTTQTVVVTDPAIATSPVNSTELYMTDVYYFYGATPPVSDQALIEFGKQWCDLLVDGMQPNDVIARIHEGAIDNDDARMHFSIVNAAIIALCPSQLYKSEEIAIRSFLPEEQK